MQSTGSLKRFLACLSQSSAGKALKLNLVDTRYVQQVRTLQDPQRPWLFNVCQTFVVGQLLLKTLKHDELRARVLRAQAVRGTLQLGTSICSAADGKCLGERTRQLEDI